MTFPRNNILVVDDEFNVAQTLTWVLQEAGYTAQFAVSGESALVVTSGIAVDAAVVDVTLPDLDGIKTAVEICKRLPNCKIPLMSGDSESAPLLERAKKDGINFDVLAKPIPPLELLGTLKALLAEHQPVR
jgi:DNA-binding response OmpR family regulator